MKTIRYLVDLRKLLPLLRDAPETLPVFELSTAKVGPKSIALTAAGWPDVEVTLTGAFRSTPGGPAGRLPASGEINGYVLTIDDVPVMRGSGLKTELTLGMRARFGEAGPADLLALEGAKALLGAKGPVRIFGTKGPDGFSSGFGADRLFGGAGGDNIAAGPGAT